MARTSERLLEQVTIPHLTARKAKGQPIVMVTAYDAPQARLADAAGVDVILVGDSLGMVTLGYDTTLPVTFDDILHHTKAARRGQLSRNTERCPEQAPTDAERARGARHALLLADMPFGTYGATPEEGVLVARRLVAEGGAQAVKLEGAGAVTLETVKRLTELGVPVMGHVGMTPQYLHLFGGFKVQGKTDAAADAILADAEKLTAAGAFGLVLEVMPATLAKRITETVTGITIGIGAGADCDGQVQVLHDLIGLGSGPPFKHARQYANVGQTIESALTEYATDVRQRRFPTAENAF